METLQNFQDIGQRLTGKFVIIPSNFVQNPLHVCVDEEDVKHIPPLTDCKQSTIALLRSSENSSDANQVDELFVMVGVLPRRPVEMHGFPDIRTKEDCCIHLHCTNTFLNHYNFTEDERVSVRCVQAFPLHRVVFCVKTEKAFAWANRHFFSSGLLLSVCQEKVLVRKNDWLLAVQNSLFLKDDNYEPSFLSDIYVVDCEPLNQGILGIKTQVVVLKLYEDESLIDRYKNNQVPIDRSLQAPLVSHFAKNLVKKDSLSQSGMPNASHDLKATLTPLVISKYVNWLNLVGRDYKLDNLATVVMNTMSARLIGAFNESLVNVRLAYKDSDAHVSTSKVARTVLVKVMTSPHCHGHQRITAGRLVPGDHCASIEDNMVLLSAPLMFLLKPKPSLTSDDSCTLCFEPFSPAIRTQGLSSLSSSCTSEVPYAKTVHLALVHSPDNQVAKSYDGAIKAYFSQARCLSLGDIISIPVAGDPSFQPNCQDTYEMRYPVLFFKVSELLPRQSPWMLYRVDSEHSSLTLAGLAHSFVPQCAVKFWSRQSCSSMWQTKSPPGFEQYVCSITQWILPYLVQKPIQSAQMFPTILLEGTAGVGKSEVIKAAAAQLNMNMVQIACTDLCGESSAATEARLRNAIQKAASFVPCIVHLRDVQSLGKDRDGRSEDTRVSSSFKQILRVVFCTITDWPMVVIATTKSATYVSREIRDCFLRELKLEPPDEVQRQCMIESLLDLDECSPGLDVKHIAQRTAGLVLGDLSALVSHARRVAYNRILITCSGGRPLTLREEQDICAAGVTLLQSDVETALDQLQSAHSDALGAPKIPDVTWDDIGGLADVKADILDTIQLPLEHPELFATGLRRSGVLLYGPPGTGKTLLAKAVATECSLNFLSVKGPELINMYVGQSEENVREVFNRARNASPCVIFFDELDSLAPNRGRSGDSGGVMDRVVSQLLAELDGLHKSCDIFVIGATNRPDLLDPALLRPGRFDKLIYLGVSEDKHAQLKILKALTRKFHLSPTCCLDYILQSCPGNLTGADFYALCSDAMLCAMKRKIQLLEAGEPVDQTRVEVENEDFLSALRSLVPSVSREEMERYKDLQDTFKNSR